MLHVLRILCRSLLPLGDGVVLDPFCGSGSTLAACKAVGYDAVGVEIDAIYFAALEANIAALAALYPRFEGDRLNADLDTPQQAPKKVAALQMDLLQAAVK